MVGKYVALLNLMLCLTTTDATKLADIEKKALDVVNHPDYDKRLIPSFFNESGGPTEVEVNIFVRAIEDVSTNPMRAKFQITYRQKWSDKRLAYKEILDKEGKDSVEFINIDDPNKIWTPDTFFRNGLEVKKHEDLAPNRYLRIFPNGDVMHSERLTVTFFCPMYLRLFPFDMQECSLQLASYSWHADFIKYIWTQSSPVQIANSLHLPGFTLMQYATSSCDVMTKTGTYSCLSLKFLLLRSSLQYRLTFFLPTFAMVVMCILFPWTDKYLVLRLLCLFAVNYLYKDITNDLPQIEYFTALELWMWISNIFILFLIIISNFSLSFCQFSEIANEKGTGGKFDWKMFISKYGRQYLKRMCLLLLFITVGIIFFEAGITEERSDLKGENVYKLREIH